MVRHTVTWNIRDDIPADQAGDLIGKFRRELEGLAGMIPGIRELEVKTEPLSGSNCDVMLYSLFESEEALAAYQIHPEHVRVSAFGGTVLQNRHCFDFQV